MFPPQKIKQQFCDVMQVLARVIMVIILQYVSISNQHVVHLKLHNVICQLYLNKIGGWGLDETRISLYLGVQTVRE